MRDGIISRKRHTSSDCNYSPEVQGNIRKQEHKEKINGRYKTRINRPFRDKNTVSQKICMDDINRLLPRKR